MKPYRFAGDGMRAATLNQKKFNDFLNAIPGAIGAERQIHICRSAAQLLEFSAQKTARQTINVSLGSNQSVPVDLPAGIPQLLCHAVISEGATVLLNVSPHHHFSKPSLVPRSPVEEAYDGRTFNELAVSLRMNGEYYLILGVNQKVTIIEDLNPAPQGAGASAPENPPAAGNVPEKPAGGNGTAEPAKSEKKPVAPTALYSMPADTLGAMIFSGRERQNPSQVLVILHVEPYRE